MTNKKEVIAIIAAVVLILSILYITVPRYFPSQVTVTETPGTSQGPPTLIQIGISPSPLVVLSIIFALLVIAAVIATFTRKRQRSEQKLLKLNSQDI